MLNRVIVFLLCMLPSLALADFQPISEKSRFLAILEGRELRNRVFGVTLDVRSNGTIIGQAQGWPVSGSWSWQDGYFCREMDWDGYAIKYNCQLVELRGTDEMRFTVDRGAGRSARFKLR